MKNLSYPLLGLLAIGFSFSIQAQSVPNYVTKKGKISEFEMQRWSHLDLAKDSIPGMSVDKAYAELLKNKQSTKVIVGIVDSGVDVEHEDLKSIIWTNPNEIPDNGKDDDKNGYIDDIHGWNFLGDINKEHLEYERILANKDLVDEATYQKAKSVSEKKLEEANQGKMQLEMVLKGTTRADDILKKHFSKEIYTLKEVEAIVSDDQDVNRAKDIMMQMLQYGMPIEDLKKEIKKDLDHAAETANSSTDTTDYRKVLGDDAEKIKNKKYGNNNVTGPNKEGALHGTHVAGIVAQVRNNGIGGDGIADNVAIMAVRAVPDGDEYDKDIALAIRYAVDNGAKVINGSFGKEFSPHKQWVFDAIKYAEKKDVLIVHAAGNDTKNIDVEDNFPNDSEDKKTEFSDNVLTIGALNPEYSQNISAEFSNYGKINVDIYAPGVQIYATAPNNSYKYLQGTSMAAPNVAGVAALIRSYYPTLTAKQVKHIIMDSGIAVNLETALGGNPQDMKPFASLCVTGKIVNAYNALKMAEELAKK